MPIRPYDASVDEPVLRECIVELQEVERAFDPRLPEGAVMVDAYVDVLLRRCAEFDGAVLVAEDDAGRALGIVSVLARVPTLESDEPAGTYALLNDLIVLPHARGRGVARTLVAAAERFAAGRGAEVLRIEVMAGNAAACALYESTGFHTRLLQLEKALGRE